MSGSNVLGEDLRPSLQRAKQGLDPGCRVTLEAGDRAEFTLSGLCGNRIFYDRYYVGEGSSVAMRWSYPSTQKTVVDGPLTHAVKTFRPGDLSKAH